MRLTTAILAGVVSLGLSAGCAERPGKKKDDGKGDAKKKDDAKNKSDDKKD